MIKIAYIGWTEPGPASGATLALQRHLFDTGEFDVLVVTDKPYSGVGPADRWHTLRRGSVHQRASRTRFRRWVAQYEMVIEPYRFSRRVTALVKSFAPDVIHTIPDTTISWVARLVAKRLGIPLVTNFQDWWPRGQFQYRSETPFSPVRNLLERRFRRMFQESSVAFCTSPGFQSFLGPHPDAPLLYPCPAPRPATRPPAPVPEPAQPLRVIYGGTLVRYYGDRLLALAKTCSEHPNIDLRLYGGKPDWSARDLQWATNSGIYRGQLSPADYRMELLSGDVFLTVMSQAPEVRTMMQTSFTTKFLEYCQFARPVIVWGPEYCEPVKIANSTNAGLAVTEEDPTPVIFALETLRNKELYRSYADGAWNAATSIFDPESIHNVFRAGIQRTLERV